MAFSTGRSTLKVIILSLLPLGALAADVLQTSGFTNCLDGSDIKVNKLDIKFDRSTKLVTFDVAGTSEKVQKVNATLTVSAYGREIYKKTFDPCAEGSKVDQLCPVPAGDFAAKGSQTIPSQYLSQIPSIAFSGPRS